jgi:hypothetical protein
MYLDPKRRDNPKSQTQVIRIFEPAAAKLYLYSPGRGIFPVQDVAGMWLKYGAKA